MWPSHPPEVSSRPNKNYTGRSKTTALLTDVLLFGGGSLIALSVFLAVWSFFTSTTNPATVSVPSSASEANAPNNNWAHDPPAPTFYDDPEFSYTIEKPVKKWDEKRAHWLNLHPSSVHAGRILMVTGSQAAPCKNPIGDHLLLRFFKNKVDYCRLHGYEIFYNNLLLQPKMFSYWAKIPVIKAAMLAHPEAEWIWWVDSDAAFTDMDFKVPLDRYKDHNLVVHGWVHEVYEKKSWTSVNAGVLLIRNCQWSMDFMDVWSKMGPQTKDYDKWGQILRSTLKNKSYPESDDQSGLIYLLLKEKEKWGEKIYIESEYYLEGYWVEIVGRFDNLTDHYLEIEKKEERLRRRHGEAVSEGYAKVREEYLKDGGGYGKWGWRRPFVTHFTGCQPCSGTHNEMYSWESCRDAMEQALNFADNQVLRNYGFVHRDLLDSATVLPLPFDYPA